MASGSKRGRTWALKEEVLYLSILAAKGVTKQLLRPEHIFLLLLGHI